MNYNTYLKLTNQIINITCWEQEQLIHRDAFLTWMQIAAKGSTRDCRCSNNQTRICNNVLVRRSNQPVQDKQVLLKNRQQYQLC